jgi:hypothetical protein
MPTWPRLFTLASIDDEYQIYLVGIDLGDQAITYRPALDGDKSQFGVHPSAESALRVYRRVGDLQLIWEDDRLTRTSAG